MAREEMRGDLPVLPRLGRSIGADEDERGEIDG